MEKVSIIVPIYNVENYVERCIKSLINQTYSNIEILLINDGSTDDSRSICEKYEKIDTRIKLYNKKNGGLSDARNYGISRITGNEILFVDSDDYIERNAVEILIKEMKKYDLDIIAGNAVIENGKGKRKYLVNKVQENDAIISGLDYYVKRIKKSCFQASPCIYMYKKELILSNNLLFEKGILHEDEEWTTVVMIKAKRVKNINFAFYHYNILREDSIMNLKDKTKNMIDLFHIYIKLEKIFNEIETNEEQHRELNDYLSRGYMNACVLYPVDKKSYKENVDYNFIFRNIRKIKTKIKLIIFFTSKQLYRKLKNQ